MRSRKIIPERRKRYGWLVLVTIFAWILLVTIVIFVDPENIRDLIIPGAYLVFALVAMVAVFLLFAIVLLSAKMAIWWTLGITIFWYLRIYGLGSWLNGISLLGVFLCGDLYWRIVKK